MTALLLPFAKRISNGELVSPDEVERGRACNCVCPGCNSEVLAKQGTEREWHFAHAKGEKCAEGYEVSIHELAKQLLRQHKELLLPSLKASVSARDAFGFLLEVREPVLQSRLVKLDECKTGVSRGGVNVDAIGVRDGREILVEVTVFHRLMPDKRDRLIATKIPSFQIDLEQFKSMQASRDTLEKALFENENIRRWIYHPKLDQAIEVAQKKLDEQLQESKARWEKDQELQKSQAATVKQVKTNTEWNSWLGADWGDKPEQRSNLMLSASLPSLEKIALSVKNLAKLTGLSEEGILSVTSTVTNRGQLRDITSEELAIKWSKQLNLSVKEVENFLVDAGYLIRIGQSR